MLLSPAFTKLLAKKFMSDTLWEDYVEWAVSELVSGHDTPNLRILAGLTKPLFWQEVEHHFALALDELQIILPPREEFLRGYVYEIASEIVSGAILPIDGCNTIYNVYVLLEYPQGLSNWMFLDDELEVDTYTPISGEKLDAAIIREAKVLLVCKINTKEDKKYFYRFLQKYFCRERK